LLSQLSHMHTAAKIEYLATSQVALVTAQKSKRGLRSPKRGEARLAATLPALALGFVELTPRFC
jgi:hypothetical protein